MTIVDKIENSRKMTAAVAALLSVFTACFINRILENAQLLYAVSAIISAAAAVWAFADSRKSEKVFPFLVRYRWALALLVFAVCVCFRLNGSSIGMYNEYLPTLTDSSVDSVLFGKPRGIRSDEWAVQVSQFFSQVYNGFALNSTQMSLSPTDMVIDYYAPTATVFSFGKPLLWGYLLFGNEIGLSWYWSGMIVLLFAVSFEFFYILTRRNLPFSFVGMLMVGFSPAMQWWMMPHLPIVFVYAMALVCVGYYFFTGKQTWLKLLTAVLAVMTLTGFALSLFPAIQVSCGYVALALLVGLLIRDREQIDFHRADVLRLLVSGGVTLAILGAFVVTGKDAISALMNTAYPGERLVRGHDSTAADLFADLSVLVLPYRDITYSNNCEVASFLQFAPACLVLYPQLAVCLHRKKDKSYVIGGILAAALILEAVFMVFGWPQWLANITLLRYCNRMKPVYGWTAVIFSIWTFVTLAENRDAVSTAEKAIVGAGYGICCLMLVDDSLVGTYMHLWNYVLLGAGVAFVLLLALFGRKRLLCCFMAALMFFAGGTVNPVQVGISPVTNHPLCDTVQELREEDPDAYWVCFDSVFVISDYFLACGAKVLTATNFYPDALEAEALDPVGEYDEALNRYSNQTAVLEDGDSSVEILAPDYICLHLNPEDLIEENVRYIVSREDYTELLAEHSVKAEEIAEEDGYHIYRLSY